MGLSRPFYSSPQGRTRFIWNLAFFAKRAGQPQGPKFFECNTYRKPGGHPSQFAARSPGSVGRQTHSPGKKAMSTGDGTSTTFPVGVMLPVAALTLKTTLIFE